MTHSPGGRRGAGRGGPRGKASPARVAAARVLVEVDQGRPVDEALSDRAPEAGPDRGMTWHLALGVLRHQASVDAALDRGLSRGLRTLDPPVRAVLRVAAFESLHGGTKAHAVVDQAVECARVVGAGRASGLVNAVLRRLRPATDLSLAQSLEHPAWLVARWIERYGEQPTREWCERNQRQPPLFVAVRDEEDGFVTSLHQAGLQASPALAGGASVPGVLHVEGHAGPVDSLPGYAEGAFWIQDAASAWMCDLIPATARSVLDACAAPGGKTLRLARRGHAVTSVDRSPKRLERLRENQRRVGFEGPVRVHDWGAGPCAELATFDAVLVDAPCTGLGTLRRRPDIRWRRGVEDIEEMSRIQAAVLRSAAAHVAPGGSLVWVVCSPEPEEGKAQIDRFLEADPRWTLEEARTTSPPSGQEDAFQGLRIRRQEAR